MTAPSVSSRPTAVARTTSGPVIGLFSEGIAAYKGVPYAAPPFGDLRFLAPQPHPPWTTPFEAFDFGATAPQREHAAPGGLPDVIEPVIPGEEILNLNIWTSGTDGSRPVLVWIHGGGFFAGCSANPWYDGASFARRGLVVVSINYRLGAEGFLELPDAPSNRGLLDCVAALEWVRANIAAFGGDPGQVTVMGQSAGGMAVASLLVSAAAEGLFRQAVIASGIARFSAWPADQAEAVTDAIAAHAGAEATRAGMAARAPLELIDAHDAVVAEWQAAGNPLMPPWGPVVDGDVVAGQFLEAVRGGRGATVPVLTGTTRNEFAWMGFRDQPGSAEARRQGQRQFADEFFRRPTQLFTEARVAINGRALHPRGSLPRHPVLLQQPQRSVRPRIHRAEPAARDRRLRAQRLRVVRLDRRPRVAALLRGLIGHDHRPGPTRESRNRVRRVVGLRDYPGVCAGAQAWRWRSR
jgi:carboxylesterase type B